MLQKKSTDFSVLDTFGSGGMYSVMYAACTVTPVNK